MFEAIYSALVIITSSLITGLIVSRLYKIQHEDTCARYEKRIVAHERAHQQEVAFLRATLTATMQAAYNLGHEDTINGKFEADATRYVGSN